MSIDSVQQVIGRAILDADFRQLLLSDPEAALSAFHLTDAEIQGLLKIDGETLEIMANAYAVSQSGLRRHPFAHPDTHPGPRPPLPAGPVR